MVFDEYDVILKRKNGDVYLNRSFMNKPKKKYIFEIVFLIVFLYISFLFISPKIQKEKSEYNSSRLKQITTQSVKSRRIDYIDENGKITIAADLGYSTVITTETNNGELERYFDDEGRPAKRRYSGYYAVLREKDDDGKSIRIIYLNKDGIPFIMGDGYAEERREYNEKEQVTRIRYFNTNGHPILTDLYAYGKIYEYDDIGNVKRIIYIDENDEAMTTARGYAVVERKYYKNGRLESEFYFDDKYNPISLSLGQYGVHKEYDEYGFENVLTYLNHEGNPLVISKGYASVERTYQPNGKIATEKYYDQNGNPVALSEGQYGIRKHENQTIYLDKYGKELYNIKNILYNNTIFVLPIVIILIIASAFVHRKGNSVLALIYIFCIFFMTLMYREEIGSNEIDLLGNYEKIFINSEARADIIRNIWLFIPLGAMLYKLYPRKRMLIVPAILSLCIEMVQYFTHLGFCEMDDILSNCIGGWMGFYIGKLTTDLLLRIKSCKHIHIM